MNYNSCPPVSRELQGLLPSYILNVWESASKVTKPCERHITKVDQGILAGVTDREFPFIACLGGIISNLASGHVDGMLYDQALTKMEDMIPGSIRIIAATMAEAINEAGSISPVTRIFVSGLNGNKPALNPA